MRVTDTLWGKLRFEAMRRRAYFTEDWREVVASDLRNCEVACVVVCALVPLLSVAAFIVYPGWFPSPAHVAVLFVAAACAAVLHALRPSVSKRPWASAAVCLAVETVLLGFAVALDTAYSYGAPGAFVQPGIIALVVIIVTPYALPLVVAALAEAVFVALTLSLKPVPMSCYDVFSGAVGLMLAFVVSQVVISLRLRDFRARESYRKLSQRDALCGVYNKGALVATATAYISMANPHVSGTVMLIDIDHFKQVNDRFGHYAGDEVLRGMGEALQGLFRATDAIGRFGGDEFMVLAEGLVDRVVAERKADELQDLMRRIGTKAIGEEVTCSIGILLVEDAEVTYESVLREVDEALYESKRAGRACSTLRRYEREGAGYDRRAHHEEAEG